VSICLKGRVDVQASGTQRYLRGGLCVTTSGPPCPPHFLHGGGRHMHWLQRLVGVFMSP
jgi:hypothetical protein